MNSAAGIGTRRDINVTPMIDVLLVLLIIFMVAMQFFAFLRVSVPPPSEPTGGAAEAQVVLEVRDDGSYAINGTVIPLGGLSARLRTLYESGHRRVLFIRTAPTRKYREVIEVVDIAQGAGVPVIGYMP